MQAVFDAAIETLREAGAEIVSAEETYDFDRVVRLHRTIMASEAAGHHRERLDAYPDDYPERIQSLIEEGSAIRASDYVRAKQIQENGRDLEGREMRAEFAGLDRFLGRVDLIATPATMGPAPDLTTTGDPCFSSPWSFFGFPTVTFPIGLSPDGLPLGIQLVGASLRDDRVLAVAAHCERLIRESTGGKGG
jgi:Asp-tRNA(Asn)/Glu-tRNA(Gln) amidotransferase A subunit family amidase